MYFKILITLAIACSIISPAINAQENTTAPTPADWEMSIYLGQVSFDQASAKEERIGDSAITVGFSADYDHRYIIGSMGFEFVSYDDKAGFSQDTVSTYGKEESSSSDASGFLLFGAAGPQWSFGEKKPRIFGQLGYSVMFGSERSIANCTNCYEESIDIEGGLFAKFGVLQNVGSAAIGINYVQYLSSDDIDSGINLVLSTSY